MENRNTLLAKLLRGLELIRVEHDRGVEGDLAIRIGLVEAADIGNVHALDLARCAFNELKHVTLESVAACEEQRVTDWTAIKNRVKSNLSGYLYKTTRRSPMILPVISEI